MMSGNGARAYMIILLLGVVMANSGIIGRPMDIMFSAFILAIIIYIVISGHETVFNIGGSGR